MATTRDSKGRITPKAKPKPTKRQATAMAVAKSSAKRQAKQPTLPVLDALMSPIVGKGKSKSTTPDIDAVILSPHKGRGSSSRTTAEKSPTKSTQKAKSKSTAPQPTPEATSEPTRPWPVQTSCFDNDIARALHATDESTIPLPPDDQNMATDLAMLMTRIWKAHKAAGGTADNQPDVINHYNQWNKEGRIMKAATTTTKATKSSTKANGNGTRALVENAATDADITKRVKAELKADPTFVAWSRIVRAIRADGGAVSRVRVETILDAERKSMPKGATKAATKAAPVAKTKPVKSAPKANGKAARKATTKAARAVKESSPKSAAKRTTKPVKRATKRVGRK
jgi:hypothetical protein